MADPEPVTEESSGPGRRGPRGPGAGWLVALVAPAALAVARGFWAPDEPRYAQVARELIESGGGPVLHLCGEPYPDKPPLLFWLSGALGRATGWSELAMRSPSLLALALLAVLTQRFATCMAGPRQARLAPWILLTMALPTELGSRLQPDTLLAALVTLALAIATRCGAEPRPTSVPRLASRVSRPGSPRWRRDRSRGCWSGCRCSRGGALRRDRRTPRPRATQRSAGSQWSRSRSPRSRVGRCGRSPAHRTCAPRCSSTSTSAA
ncbi:MAG: glycosyltransferase family 39 protein [Planctomycetes bacterium]|nr:glycosyltransferase family 39 protein [Planctomycetota bacterium]